MKKILSLLSLVLLFQIASAHKFYASLTEANFNTETKSLELILKFFVDDFEEAIHFNSGIILSLGDVQESNQADSLILAYVQAGFQISQNDHTLEQDYIGFESDKDYVWIYIEIKQFDPDQSHQLNMSLLTEVFEEQSNQINLNANGKLDSFTLHKNKTSVRF